MLHGMPQRILRSWLTAVAVAVTVASRMTSAADAPPLFPEPMSAGEIQLALQKLNALGRVLYIAAHPDDENTNLMAFWANGSLYETAYLSITRGDGGQNLIGPELRERLGVIRTEELLAARRVDHGKQFFSRAIDFGFSKTAEETMRIWDHDKILSDVVWVVRKFRPDVIVTRFSPEDQLTHGHHTASAILAGEAFSAAGDPNRFPEQLAFVKPWRPTRLVWNTSPFFFSNRNLPFDPTGLTVLEAGGYNSLLGKAYTEIAAASLSMHKSQGVGSPPRRGARKEYFKLLEGEPMTSALFDGVDTSWSRVANSESVAAKIRQIISEFHPADPAASVADQKLIGLPENPPHLPMEITLQVSGQDLRYVVDTRYRTVDPVAGELRQPLVIAPPVFTDFANGVLMFATNQTKSVPVRVTAATGPVTGQLTLSAPDGWPVDPAGVQVDPKG